MPMIHVGTGTHNSRNLALRSQGRHRCTIQPLLSRQVNLTVPARSMRWSTVGHREAQLLDRVLARHSRYHHSARRLAGTGM
jgi:hypothetical protein